YDPTTGAYALFPDAEPFKAGLGFFLNAATPQSPFTVSGRIYSNIAGTVALRPGWNLISNPLEQTTTVDNMLSVHAADFPRFFTDAEGSDIGTVFYEFQPGANDAASGVPETGSMVPATSFEAGKAYFVQVFSPEGVTLVFESAPTGQAAVRTGNRTAGRSGLGWLMGVTLIDGKFRIGAQIGQDTTATRGFDRAEDAALPPPLTGGRQVIVTDAGSLYRDVRRVGNRDVYTIRLTGLTPGKSYTLSFDKIQNSPGAFIVTRQDGSIVGSFRAGQQVQLRASSSSYVFKIRVSGVVYP
ncbi:MAG TPA: hypothetical protein VMI31_01360, partial [Fimbriimonadaceae bacterium]|nr:hypothetical protein [Fimbriimonadaceae bacterium]